MSDKLAKSKQSKRAYLFVLLTGVLFLLVLCFFPQSSSKSCLTKVDVQIQAASNQLLVKEIVVDEIKKQLTAESLAQTLNTISTRMELQSSLLVANVSDVREKLLQGALNVEAIPDSPESEEFGFSISIEGEGTEDEKEFVHLLANAIEKSLSPSSQSDLILAQVKIIQSKLQESAELNSASRSSVESSFKNYADNQKRLFTNAGSEIDALEVSPSNWELKNLVEQRRLAYQEYQSNQSRDFAEKMDVQDSLIRRMEYLDQEINRLRKKTTPSERMANKEGTVEKASFLDSSTTGIQPFEVDKELEKLKTDLALVVSKLDVAKGHFRESQKATEKLTELLDQELASVSVSSPTLTEKRQESSSHLWMILAISGTVSAVIVFRIDQRAFGNFLFEKESVEKALQMPVIGQIELPSENADTNRQLRIHSKLINGSIKSCEVLIAVALIAFFVILLNSSDFTIHWLNDPIGLLRNSFK